jgi:hypothetical protein
METGAATRRVKILAAASKGGPRIDVAIEAIPSGEKK